jgi:leucyl-tRNA synthetase
MPLETEDRHIELIDKQLRALWRLGHTTTMQIAELTQRAQAHDRELHELTSAVSTMQRTVESHVLAGERRDDALNARMTQFVSAQERLQAAVADTLPLLQSIRDAQTGRRWLGNVLKGASGGVVALLALVTSAALIVRWLTGVAVP